jgi:hypothetical protein
LDVTAETDDCPAANNGIIQKIRLESDGYVDFINSEQPASTQDELQVLVTSNSLEAYFNDLFPKQPLSVWHASIQEPNATTTSDWNAPEFWSTPICGFGAKSARIAAVSIARIVLAIGILLCCCAYCIISTLTCGCCSK